MFKLIFLSIFINLLGFSLTEQCNPSVVEWIPHQYSCSKFILCYHGHPIEKNCAPGLHFSPTELKCMVPKDAKCDENYVCPEIDDHENPILLPDRIDCQRFFVCFNGSLIGDKCAAGLWWDVVDEWCTTPEKVTCDNRTINNPGVNVGTTEISTEGTTLPTTIGTTHDCTTGGTTQETTKVTTETSTGGTTQETTKVTTETTTGRTETTQGVTTEGTTQETTKVTTETTTGRTETTQGETTEATTGGTTQETTKLTTEGTTESSSSKPVPNVNICFDQRSIHDCYGNYLKSLCTVNIDSTYYEAERRCIENGMKLLIINNYTVQTALFETVTKALEYFPGGYLWINGRRFREKWFVESPQREELYKWVDWVVSGGIDGSKSGDCLRYSQQYGPYRALGVNCNSRSWSICEY